MCLMKWAEKKIRKFTAWDMAMTKVALIAFGMMVGAYWAVYVRPYVSALLIIWIVLYLILIYRFFSKKWSLANFILVRRRDCGLYAV